MKVVKVERFLAPSGALFEKEDEAVNEMLNFASQLVSQAEPAALVNPEGPLSEALALLGEHATAKSVE